MKEVKKEQAKANLYCIAGNFRGHKCMVEAALTNILYQEIKFKSGRPVISVAVVIRMRMQITKNPRKP